jgi:hypothetical protein
VRTHHTPQIGADAVRYRRKMLSGIDATKRICLRQWGIPKC